MKQIILTITGCIILSLAFAQGPSSGKIRIGGGLAYGSEIKNLGLNILGTYDITDNIRVAPNLTIFMPHKDEFIGWTYKLGLWELNLDAHYIIPVNNDMFDVYPLAGINIAFLTSKGEVTDPTLQGNPVYEFSTSDVKFGLNLGVGGEYPISEQLGVFLELRYAISDFDQFVVKTGVAYRL
ncbi:MAG: outer membrane beta-barrel protein [Bacteroidetes bacterium]|nr:outer membrane beta-barrel protein [Bacteroidota bacterium]